MNGGHLCCKHGFHLVGGLHPFDDGEHEIEPSRVYSFTLSAGIGELPENAVQEVRVSCAQRLHEKNMGDCGLQMIRRNFRHTLLLGNVNVPVEEPSTASG